MTDDVYTCGFCHEEFETRFKQYVRLAYGSFAIKKHEICPDCIYRIFGLHNDFVKYCQAAYEFKHLRQHVYGLKHTFEWDEETCWEFVQYLEDMDVPLRKYDKVLRTHYKDRRRLHEIIPEAFD